MLSGININEDKKNGEAGMVEMGKQKPEANNAIEPDFLMIGVPEEGGDQTGDEQGDARCPLHFFDRRKQCQGQK